MRHSLRAVRLLVCIVLTWLVLFPCTTLSGYAVQFPDDRTEPESKSMRELLRQQEKARNADRQQDLKQDTEKLLQLATELKLAVDKSSENTLSMDVIKKAEQIEKLSKSVQKKMRGY